MKAICVDDEVLLLKALIRVVKESPDIESAEGFKNAEETIAFANENKFDIAFLDIELDGMNGIDIAENLRKINPDCGIIYCTGYKKYALEAIEKHIVDGYLIKPIDADDVQKEIDLYKEKHGINYLLTVRGNSFFDQNGNLLMFKRSKTNELLSELIKAQGAVVTVTELCYLLWDDNEVFFNKNKSYLRQITLDLKNTLKAANAEDILIKAQDGYAVNMKALSFKT